MYAFAHIYKCAGTTFKSILRRNFGIRHFDTGLLNDTRDLSAAQLRRVRWIFPNLISIAGHEVRSYSDLRWEYPDIRFYTFLRKPEARAISAFRTKSANCVARDSWRPETSAEVEKALVDFLLLQKNKMCSVFAPGAGVDEAIERMDREFGFVGIVEEFDLSLSLFCDWIAIKDFDLRYRVLNTSRNRVAGHYHMRAFAAMIERGDKLITEVSRQSNVSDLLQEVTESDKALYDFALARKLGARLSQSAGAEKAFSHEDSNAPGAAWPARLHRGLIARNLIPLVVHGVEPFRPGGSR